MAARPGIREVMPAPSAAARSLVLAAIAEGPATTSQLYDRIGYPALMRARLIDYRAFRELLSVLEAENRITGEPDPDEEGALRWSLR